MLCTSAGGEGETVVGIDQVPVQVLSVSILSQGQDERMYLCAWVASYVRVCDLQGDEAGFVYRTFYRSLLHNLYCCIIVHRTHTT